MGGTTEPIITALKDTYTENADLADAVKIAVDALRVGIASSSAASGSGSGSSSSSASAEPRTLDVSTLEVAILDANRPRRAFRRITGPALEAVLPQSDPAKEEPSTAVE
jgi:proteasome alpha subunit